jgi:hypothetical protein
VGYLNRRQDLKKIDELEKWMGNFSVDFPCFVGENEDFPCSEQRFLFDLIKIFQPNLRLIRDLKIASQVERPRHENHFLGKFRRHVAYRDRFREGSIDSCNPRLRPEQFN